MQIDPLLQAKMLLTAFLAGVALGLLLDLFTAVQMALGVFSVPPALRRLYARPLPLVARCVPYPEAKRGYRVRAAVLLFMGDLLFCLVAGAVLLLVTFAFNDGRIRLSVPVLQLLGLAAWRLTGAKLTAQFLGVVAFLFGAAATYVRVLISLPARAVSVRVRRLLNKISERKEKRRAAAKAHAPAQRRKEGSTYGKEVGRLKSNAAHHSHTHHRYFLPLSCHFRGQNAGNGQVESPRQRVKRAKRGLGG